MRSGVNITVVDVDRDYLGIEIRASNDRFAGSARIYAGLTQLTEFADAIAGFPSSPQDERKYVFGASGQQFAGGCCNFSLRCTDYAGHARLDVAIEDDEVHDQAGIAKFGFGVLAADIDQFTLKLREMEKEQTGEATLPSA